MLKWTLYNVDTDEYLVLTRDPEGWTDLVLTHERDAKYHGLNYDFTTELGFFCKGGGKEFVDQAYEDLSQEANVRVKLDVKHNGSYTNIFNGKLNFSSYREEYKSNVLYTWLDAERDDIKTLINNREDLEVNLLSNTSLDGVALNTYPYLGYDVNMHSKIIRIESEWESETHGCCFQFISTGFRAFYAIPTTTLVKGDFEKSTVTESRCVNPVVFDNFLDDAQPIINTTNSPVFTDQNTVRITWDIAGQLSVTTFNITPVVSNCDDSTCGTGGLHSVLYDSVDLRLRVYFGNTGDLSEADDCGANPIAQEGIKFIDLITIPTFAVVGNPTVKNFANSGSRDVILNPGDKVYYYWVADLNVIESADFRFDFTYSSSTLNILSDTISRETTCNAIGIHEAWSRLSEIITDQPLAFRSEFFGRTNSNIVYDSDGCGSRVALTSGKNIRQLDNSPPVKISLSKMFESCDAIWGLGLGVEQYQGFNVIIVEEVGHFYSSTEILKLDFVPNIQVRHLSDRVYNEIKLGFAKWETRAVNGLIEPLSKINYSVPPIKSNKQKFERISQFVAGMYAIEATRRAGAEETKDTPYDEDVFILALRTDDLTRCEKDENMVFVSNLSSPETAYNLRFLLSSTFDRLKNQFVAGLTKLGTLPDPVLMPSQGEGNQTVFYQYVPNGCAGDHRGTAQLNGGAGKYPDAQARRDNPIWEPIEITFDYPLSFTDYLKIVANPYGLIRVSHSDSNYMSGWILNLSYNLVQKTGSFTILKKFG